MTRRPAPTADADGPLLGAERCSARSAARRGQRRFPGGGLGTDVGHHPPGVVRALHGDKQRGQRSGITTLPALLLGVLVTGVTLAAGGADSPQGPRLAVAAALPLFLLGVLALRPVDERRREDPTAPVPALG
ncbi:MAG: hypothetical protein H0V12_06025 [Chloroflexi bacterium]|nr:hypothetical protein [Chloroflexota bacterium]